MRNIFYRRLVVGGMTVLAGALLLAFAGGVTQAATIYVSANAPAGGDGLAWATAKQSLVAALSQAASGDEIWIAAGTYTPTTGTDRTISFVLKAGVGVYGGFAGTETAREQRNWTANITTLSGDIGTGGDNADNSYHVVTATGDMQDAVLDGFTVSGGNANWQNSDSSAEQGGGAYFHDLRRLVVSNCIFSGNIATECGGGMFSAAWSSPAVTNCTFSGNTAATGGGIYNVSSSSAVTNCTFSGNTATQGAGMANISSSTVVTNCTFSNNIANNAGGGLYNYNASPTVTNCTFSANAADHAGGMFNSDSSSAVTNCTFSGNTAISDGGGMYNTASWSPPMPVLTNCTFSGNTANRGGGMVNDNRPSALTNCILWGDTASVSGAEIYDSASTATVSYSCIAGGYGGTGNIATDPLFVNALGPDGIAGTADDDLRLQPGSPCIDAGSNAAVPAGITTDLAGNRRFDDDVSVTDTGSGTAPIVDMGAYERAFKPWAVADTATVLHGAAVTIPVLANDVTLNGGTLSITSVTQGTHGSVVINGNSVVYTANINFSGTDGFTYTISAGAGLPDTGSVTVTVTNTAPVADGQTVSTHWGTAKAITLTGSDADNDPIAFSVVADPQHGTLSGTIPNLTYTPTGTYVGSDTFTFKVNDGAVDSNVATVTIDVTNTAPTVTASAAPTSVVPDGNVVFTANGSDPDGDALTYSWDFGDGGTSNEQNPTHAYSAVGVYTAVVIVTDPAGATGSNSVTIQVSKAPTVRLTTSDVVAFGGNPFQFDASYSTDLENAIASYTWDFGDGTPPGSGQVISKVYDSPGEYTVTLTVTDAAGVSSTLTRIIQVLPASELGLFNGYVNYKTNWDRTKTKTDSISVDACVNVGDTIIGPNTTMALEIAGQRFTATLDKKLRDYTNSDAKWQVKAGIRHQPYGTVTLKLKIKNADLGAGFNQAGALVGTDSHNKVKLDIPVKLDIGDQTFELDVPSEFKFNKDGTKAKGTGAS